MGFPEEPKVEMRIRCPLVMSIERVMTMPVSFHLRQQDQEEVPGQEVEDAHTDDMPAPEPEIQRSPAPQMSPPSPPLHTTSAAAADTPGPFYSAHHSPEYIHASSREIAGVMDAICSLAATQAAQDQRLAQCHSMLQQMMTHLGLPRDPDQREEPTTDALWMFWLQQQQLQTHHHHSREVVRFLLHFCIVISFINCLLILIRIYVLAIVGSDTFVFSFVCMY